MDSRKLGAEELRVFLNGKNAPLSLATVCGQEEAQFSFGQERPVYFRFCTYDLQAHYEILKQASDWVLKVVRTESWDPSLYAESKVVKESIQTIDPKTVLVKDGAMAGLVSYTDFGGTWQIDCALTEEAEKEPVLFQTYFGFGSGDRDMMYTINTYLMRNGS